MKTPKTPEELKNGFIIYKINIAYDIKEYIMNTNKTKLIQLKIR